MVKNNQENKQKTQDTDFVTWFPNRIVDYSHPKPRSVSGHLRRIAARNFVFRPSNFANLLGYCLLLRFSPLKMFFLYGFLQPTAIRR